MVSVASDAFPWSVIVPELEAKAKIEGASAVLRVWKKAAFDNGGSEGCPLVMYCENGFFHARQHALHAAEEMRKLVGGARATALMQTAIEADAVEDKFGSHHDVWRLYMFMKGVCEFGYVEQKDEPSKLWGRRVDSEGIWTSWNVECLIEAGRTGSLEPPSDNSPIWRKGCM